jgi:L-ribulose-5-phosphate 3-epimerase UlaE
MWHDLFGGVGISCLDFSQLQSKMLAAVTVKTFLLEIWDTQTNQLVKAIPCYDQINQI